MNKRVYGLFTAITMITGVVIGSGIFFKADDVLRYTNGNVILGILVFCISAIAIVFGCLSISQLATRTDKPGGLIAYAEEFVGMGSACAFGWFQTFLYLPTISAVVSWVIGIYICQLFGIEFSLEITSLIGFACMTVLFIFNVISAKLGGFIQNGAMIIKLIPLILIAVAGLIFGQPGELLVNDVKNLQSAGSDYGWIAAFAPIAFSFDGWIVSTSICSEIKNSKRNLPLALTFSPLLILLAYVAYFLGMNFMLGPEQIMLLEDASAYTVAQKIFGQLGGKIILIFIIISVIGTVNGLVLGYIRMPYSLALRNMLPGSKVLSKEEEKLGGMPLNSAIFAYFITAVWMLVHYFTQRAGMRGDVSEIAIGVSYLNYLLLYVAVMRLTRKGDIKSKIKGYVIPIFASIGSLLILSGSVNHPLFLYNFAICLLIMVVSYVYYKVNKARIK